MTNRIPLKWSTTWYDQTRVDFNIYVLDPATDLNPKQLYTYVKW